MSAWKTLARQTNSLPPGWATADEISADLDCEPNEVPKILATAIRDGLVEKQTFPHWQPGSRQLLYQTGYRQITGKPQTKTKEPTADDLEASIRAAHRRHPHLSPGGLREYLPKRHRRACSAAQIASILSGD